MTEKTSLIAPALYCSLHEYRSYFDLRTQPACEPAEARYLGKANVGSFAGEKKNRTASPPPLTSTQHVQRNVIQHGCNIP